MHGKRVPLISAVVALSARNVWAVGGYDYVSTTEKSVIAHWNGHTLRVWQPFRRGHLEAVAATAPNDVWAVGIRGNNPVVEHWDGRRWAEIDTPVSDAPIAADAREGYLFDVVAVSRRDAWAVGRHNDQPLVLHWNGKKWSIVAVEGNWLLSETELNAVDGTSSRDLWAVGTTDYNRRPLALHWDGRSWREESSFYPSSVNSDQMELVRLDVRSPHDIWALESTTEEDFVLHWDGNEQHVIAASSETLDDIAPISTSNIVGVGWSEYDKTYPNITHWNGERWRTTKTPLNNLRNTTMEGLYQVSPNDTWAVGAHLIARYSCAST